MKKVTVSILKQMKKRGKKITALTAYDALMAERVDRAGIDEVLVGDSLGMVMLGYTSTRFVTMDEMVHHAKAVRRGVKRALLIGDMPYRAYRTPQQAYRNAVRFVKEAGCDGVKLEGGRKILPMVRFLRRKRIEVQGHLGLMPQSVAPGKAFRLQAKDVRSAKRLVEDALLLEEAGVFSVVLESIPSEVSKAVFQQREKGKVKIGPEFLNGLFIFFCPGNIRIGQEIKSPLPVPFHLRELGLE